MATRPLQSHASSGTSMMLTGSGIAVAAPAAFCATASSRRCSRLPGQSPSPASHASAATPSSRATRPPLLQLSLSPWPSSCQGPSRRPGFALGGVFGGEQLMPTRSLNERGEGLRRRPRIHNPSVIVVAGESLPEIIDKEKKTATNKIPAKERDAVMSAVDKLGYRVTVGDVAGEAGLKLNLAERALQAIVQDTNGTLQVSDKGDVLYCIPQNFRATLQARSLVLRLQPFLTSATSTAEYLVRVSFGTTLLASIAIVYASIMVIMSSSQSNERDDRRGGGGYGRAPSMGIYINPFDLFWYWDPYYYRRRRMEKRRPGEKDEMNFFEGIFSFVLGDGDANADLEERRWKQIGALIQRKGGVVTAEELAPFLDPPAPKIASQSNVESVGGLRDSRGREILASSSGASSSAVRVMPTAPEDEGFVLPVLQKFDGHAEVDPQGNLIYRFPSLQTTAVASRDSGMATARTFSTFLRSSRRQVPLEDDVVDASYLEEREQTLSKASDGQRLAAILLGAANLVGVLFLTSLLKDVQLVRQIGPGIVSFAASILPLLQAYAISFFAIPAFRWWKLNKENAEIKERNSLRRKWAALLSGAVGSALRRKMENAKGASRVNYIGSSDRIVYSSDQDLGDYEAKEFDRRLNERLKNLP